MKNKGVVIAVLGLLSAAVILAAPFWGAQTYSLREIMTPGLGERDVQIFWQMRLPRVLVAFCVGGIFALCGMVFQAIFRNPLVCPFTLGVSAGASFGATVYIWLGLSFAVLGISGVSLFAFAGALLSIIIVWSLSRIRYGSSTAKMLLAGLIVSFFFISLIMFIQFISGVYESFRISRWLMGSLTIFGYGPLWEVWPFALAGVVVIFYFSRELNLLTTGEEIAVSRGVDVNRMVKGLFVFLSIIIGRLVAICGPIAFVGIIAPHICRLLIGPDHRYLTPATFLFGGLFLTLCDMLARTVVAPGEMPVGIITAILGGPFFLWLLHAKFNE